MSRVLLQLKDIRKVYGASTILEDASASFADDQKIGVVGRNGAGKSTLCKIMTGQEEADSGTISRNSDLCLSYLEQHDPFSRDETVLDFLNRYTGKEEWQCGETAGRFQIRYELLGAKIGTLAGGFQTRVKLTAMLLRDPNFLVLDEPSNYLDLSTLILLENFLLDYRGGYVIVSHDREFLKRTCDHTLEVEHGRLTLYPGDIEEYFEFKEEQIRQKMAYNRTIEKKKEQLQEFIDRFKAKAATAGRAKSKMKQMSKLKTISIQHHLATVSIKIPPVERKAGVALSCEELSVGYPTRTVAEGIHMDIERGMKVAVLGDNGQGKTTFLRTVAGDLAAKSGSYRWGTGLKLAYYAQHVFASLHPQDDVFSHLQREASLGVTTQEILDLAGCFLFRGDEVKKKVTVLSGGERARLCLAGLLLSKSHVLLLDEPTNHLDFETVEALGEALKTFAGTIFFISHDRTFVNMLATHILDVKDGRIVRYPGIYEDYVYHLEMLAREQNPAGEEEEDEKAAASEAGGGSQGARAGQSGAGGEGAGEEMGKAERREVRAQLTELKVKFNKLERKLEHQNREKEALFKEIQENPFHYSRQRNEKMKELTALIEQGEDQWMRLEAEMEKLKKRLGEGA
ncbi:MAG: ATP-binding cassette domain-containing protein [Candidatus Omnitrophota bacterium]|jgi:ATP-binding cassette subfamily F protein 3